MKQSSNKDDDGVAAVVAATCLIGCIDEFHSKGGILNCTSATDILRNVFALHEVVVCTGRMNETE